MLAALASPEPRSVVHGPVDSMVAAEPMAVMSARMEMDALEGQLTAIFQASNEAAAQNQAVQAFNDRVVEMNRANGLNAPVLTRPPEVAGEELGSSGEYTAVKPDTTSACTQTVAQVDAYTSSPTDEELWDMQRLAQLHIKGEKLRRLLSG